MGDHKIESHNDKGDSRRPQTGVPHHLPDVIGPDVIGHRHTRFPNACRTHQIVEARNESSAKSNKVPLHYEPRPLSSLYATEKASLLNNTDFRCRWRGNAR